jgi:hypothetical protein
MMPSRSDRPAAVPPLGKVSPTTVTWAVTLAVLISASIFAASFGVLDTEQQVSAQRTVAVANHAADAPAAPSTAPAKAANADSQ